MLVHRIVTPSSKFAGTHLYTWVERGTMRVKYLAQEHNAVPRPGLEPGPPDPESSALTIRPPRLPDLYQWRWGQMETKPGNVSNSIVLKFGVSSCSWHVCVACSLLFGAADKFPLNIPLTTVRPQFCIYLYCSL